MKKQIILVLFIAISLKSFAGTGGASDELMFLFSILGFLSMLVILLYLIDYGKKNGKTLVCSSRYFLKKQFSIIRAFIQNLVSDYLSSSFQKGGCSIELKSRV